MKIRILLNTNLHPENKLTELELNWLVIYTNNKYFLFSPPKRLKHLGGLQLD